MGEKGNVAAGATSVPVTQANRGLGGQLTPTSGLASAAGTPQPDVRLGTQSPTSPTSTSTSGGGGTFLDLADSARDFALGAVSEAAVERYVDSRDKSDEAPESHGEPHLAALDAEQPVEAATGDRQYF